MQFKSILTIAVYVSVMFTLAAPISESNDGLAGTDVEDIDSVRVNRNGSGNGPNSGNGGAGGDSDGSSGGGNGGNGGTFGGNTGNRVSGNNNRAGGRRP
ncbi:hypothetical protein AB1N83_014055 [Pleurotus pulmonarius]